ncbi:MAG: exodeoxyribonuclease VII small subunit [Acidimicrobiia bacterium]
MTMGAKAIDKLTYLEASQELEAILTELEGEQVDVDRLAEQVRRATALIAGLRDRIEGARLEVETAVAELEALEDADEDADEDDEE